MLKRDGPVFIADLKTARLMSARLTMRLLSKRLCFSQSIKRSIKVNKIRVISGAFRQDGSEVVGLEKANTKQSLSSISSASLNLYED